MLAMYGRFVLVFSPGVVFASVIIAFVAAAAGLAIVVQIAYAGQTWLSLALRSLASVVISFAVNAMH